MATAVVYSLKRDMYMMAMM